MMNFIDFDIYRMINLFERFGDFTALPPFQRHYRFVSKTGND